LLSQLLATLTVACHNLVLQLSVERGILAKLQNFQFSLAFGRVIVDYAKMVIGLFEIGLNNLNVK